MPAEIRGLREVLRGYVGERILIAGSRADAGRGQADMVQVLLPPVSAGAASMRAAMERARAMMGAGAPVPLLGVESLSSDPAYARVLATVLLGSGGAALLRVDDLDLAHASDSVAGGSVFAWSRQWSGLHRGSAIQRSGTDTLLNRDADGALVWVRQARDGGAPVVAICNVTDRPLRMSLVDDFLKLGLRGSFLRTVARSDGGMGAMPLRAVELPAYGVYVGELGR